MCIGSPAMTSRGFGVVEAEQLVNWMCDVLEDIDNELLKPYRINPNNYIDFGDEFF